MNIDAGATVTGANTGTTAAGTNTGTTGETTANGAGTADGKAAQAVKTNTEGAAEAEHGNEQEKRDEAAGTENGADAQGKPQNPAQVRAEGAQTDACEDVNGGKADTDGRGADIEKMRGRLSASLAKTAALQAGVSAERVSAAMRLADISGIDPLAEDAETQFSAAIAKALTVVPELRSGGTGGSGEHRRTAAEAISAFERGFR